MKIFLSYGHDEYEKIAQRLKRDLQEEGFEIWIDKESIRGTADWESAIEKGISTSDWLVLMMTEHSVRRPDGVCLDEVSYARFLGKNIAPIMIQEVKPPLCIARIQWIDMKNFFIPGKAYFDEDSYQQRKEELLAILNGIKLINLEGGQKSLRNRLNPLDNDVYSREFGYNYYGGQRLLEYYDQWYESSKRVLWLVGDAGIGKTAFVANLIKIRSEMQAVHFCRYNDSERANPKRAIMSIAYYMSTQIKEYHEQLLELSDLDKLIEKNTGRLFEYLITEPLNKIRYEGKPIVIVIDALDEATVNGRNELSDVIAKQFENTPEWLKIVITSRKEALLERKLSKYKPVDFGDPLVNDNNADIRGYYDINLKNILEGNKKKVKILNQLVEKSEGIFLYAKTIVDELKENKLSITDIDDFPEGLTGIYYDYFERMFSREQTYSYKENVRPYMEILCATFVPVSEKMLCEILDVDEYDFADICELISEMFPVKNGVMEPIHKSIVDWLADSKKSGFYRVSSKRGHAKIAKYYMEFLKRGKWHPDALKYLCKHLLAEGKSERAAKVLGNREFQEKRISIIGLDSAIRDYLFEIYELLSIEPEWDAEVFESEAFVCLFSKYRKFLYNSGLYFELKKCSFDKFLSVKKSKWDIDSEIGIAYYYYITESFSEAVIAVKKILDYEKDLLEDMKEELHNLLALCYRKSVDFDKSKHHFNLAFETGKKTDGYYNQSISLINLGKIAYHELDWQSAKVWNKKAIEYLEKELEKATDNDYIISLKLFIAEYHRLSAECLVWSGALESVDKELEMARSIYEQVQTRDRYYIRFLYTSVFRNVLAGKYEDVLDDTELFTSIYKEENE